MSSLEQAQTKIKTPTPKTPKPFLKKGEFKLVIINFQTRSQRQMVKKTDGKKKDQKGTDPYPKLSASQQEERKAAEFEHKQPTRMSEKKKNELLARFAHAKASQTHTTRLAAALNKRKDERKEELQR